MGIAFFDLEVKYMCEELDPEILAIKGLERKTKEETLIPKQGLATACIITDGSKPKTFFFDEGKEKGLLDALDAYNQVIGHNVLHFDYPVLSTHFRGDVVNHFKPKTLDTFEALKIQTNGQWIGLNDLAQLNLGKKKTENSKEIPGMWRAGKKELVRKYCENDVKLLKEIYYHGKEYGKLKYTKKHFGTVLGIEEVTTPWQ